MSSVTAFDVRGVPEKGGTSYLNAEAGVWSWLTTVDHKRIGMMYLVSTLIAFGLGGFFALALRLELLTPQKTIMSADMYNQAFTLHGAIMVFLFIIPSIPGAIANFVVPIMIGAKDVAFPRLNLLSLYIYWVGAIFALTAIVTGGVDTGWTFYTPYSTTTNTSVIWMTMGAFILGFSSILTGLNFIVTIHKLRAPGLSWYRMPLFLWATYATSIIQVLATPVLGITLLLLVFERAFGIGIFDPQLGGDPVLFQHFFWFYSHPAVYIMILPGMGIISELIAVHSQRNACQPSRQLRLQRRQVAGVDDVRTQPLEQPIQRDIKIGPDTRRFVQGIDLDIRTGDASAEIAVIGKANHRMPVTVGRNMIDEIDQSVFQAADGETVDHMHDQRRRAHRAVLKLAVNRGNMPSRNFRSTVCDAAASSPTGAYTNTAADGRV